jgi:hypothetical protein
MGTMFPKNEVEAGIVASFEAICVAVLQSWESEEDC